MNVENHRRTAEQLASTELREWGFPIQYCAPDADAAFTVHSRDGRRLAAVRIRVAESLERGVFEADDASGDVVFVAAPHPAKGTDRPTFDMAETAYKTHWITPAGETANAGVVADILLSEAGIDDPLAAD